MAYKECGSKMVSGDDYIYSHRSKARFLKQTWRAIILAILINGILIISSYNYVQYLAYRENIQIIKLENYKNEQKNIEQKNVQFEKLSRVVHIE